MQYLNKLRPIYFFGAFLLGILYIYLLQPGLRYISRHPTPENAGKIIYTIGTGFLAQSQGTAGANSGQCFTYKLIPMDCPQDKNAINNQPIVVKE